MRRSPVRWLLLSLTALLLTGCASIGSKAASISVVYGITTVVSLLLLAGYCGGTKKRDAWYLLLFTCVLVVNIGYFALSISGSLEEALLANRVAYLGSAFLPLAMWMIIIRSTHIRYGKWMPGMLAALAVVVFLIAASPGYLPVYYREVSFERVNGVSTLVKVYGPLHVIYLIYLLGYFTAMVSAIVYATVKDKIDSTAYATILAVAVFVNIGVWMIEQLVKIDFEILSVSYIISESFLLGLNLLMKEAEKQKALPVQAANPEQEEPSLPEPELPPDGDDPADQERMECFLNGITKLTPKEQQIFNCYLEGMSTGRIMEELAIKENTLKFHNKNIYGKLGVSSRRRLLELYRQCVAGGKLRG